MADSYDGLEDFDSYSAGGPRHALKSAVNFKDLVDGKSFKFEIDDEHCFDVDDDTWDSEGEDLGRPGRRREGYFFNNPEYQWQPADDSFRLDEPVGDFDKLEATMEPIHESNRIKKMVVKEGNSIKVPQDAKVFIQYVGFAEGQNEPFDKVCRKTKKSVAGVFLGGGEIVYGLREGIRTMCVGEIARFLIYPEFAFGSLGCAPRIPAGARVVFTVEMLRFVPAEKFKEVFYMSPDDRAQLPFAKILEAAKDCKNTGNKKYYERDYYGAMKLYSRGIIFLEDYPSANEVDNKARDDEISILCSNKAQSLIKMNAPERACVACRLGLRCANNISRPKLLIRFAEAKFMLNALDDAFKYCNEAIRLFKTQDIVDSKHSDLLMKIQKAKEKQDERDTFLCKKMFQFQLSTRNSASETEGEEK